VRLNPPHERPRVAAVGPDPEQAGPDRGRPSEHEFRAVSVLQAGAMHHDRQYQAQRIYQEMALSTVNLFVFVAADRGLGPPFW